MVYAFMGALWWLGRVRPGWVIQPPSAIFTFMWIWLLVGLTGVLEIIGFGAIANGAHFGGLLAGLGSAMVITSLHPEPGAH